MQDSHRQEPRSPEPSGDAESLRGLPRIAAYPLPGRDSRQFNRVDWTLEPRRAALLVHDAQNYWLRRFERPEALVANMTRVRRAARMAGLPTIFTGARFAESPRSRGLAMDMWGPGLGAGVDSRPDDGEIIPELEREPADRYVEKLKYSAFFATRLERDLQAHGIDQLVICGVYAHHGILLTAADAYMRDIQVFFVVDASGDHSSEFHQMAVRIMADLCAQNVDTDSICAALAPGGSDLR